MAEQTGAGPKERRIPAVAEALGYVGGALALSAVIALLSSYWRVLGAFGHVGVGVVAALAGLLGGFMVGRTEGEAAERLSHFLLLAGVAGVAVAAGFAVRDTLFDLFAGTASIRAASERAAEWGWFAGAAALAVSGGLVWWVRRSVLQHLAFGAGVAGAALLALPLFPPGGPEWGVGLTLIVVALAWGALTLVGRLTPREVGLVLASLGLLGGLELMAFVPTPRLLWPIWLGALAAALLVWVGSRLRDLPVLGIGTVGLMVFAGQLIGEYVGFGAVSAIALILVGFALLGVGIRLVLRLTPDTTQDRRVAAEVISYLGVALAMGGAGILLAQYWDELGVAGHVAVPLIGSLVAYGCALVVGRSETGIARRLGQALYAIGVLAAAVTGAMVMRPFAESALPHADDLETAVALAGGVTGVLVGGITWWRRPGSLTQIAFFAALVATLVALGNLKVADRTVSFMATAASIVALGTLWVLLGLAERIRPTRTALAVGCYGCIQGLQMLIDGGGAGFQAWAALLGLVYGAVGVVTSIYVRRGILLGFGAVAIVMFSMVLVMELFATRIGAPLALLIVGVVFIAVAVVAAKAAPRIRREKPPTELPSAPSGAA